MSSTHYRDHLEEPVNNIQVPDDWNQEMLFSIAISLRRIADALEQPKIEDEQIRRNIEIIGNV